MTLIFSKYGGRFVMQVSDRLLTRNRKDVFDGAANKSLIFLAADARVTMAWTGSAFVGTLPTDYFIAESLQGRPIVFHDDQAPADERRPAMIVRSGDIPEWPTLTMALQRLGDSLSQAWQYEPDAWRAQSLRIVGVGWSWDIRYEQRPIGFDIVPDLNGKFIIRWAPDVGKDLAAFTASGYISHAELEEIVQSISNLEPLNAEAVLVDRLRAEADTNAVVGRACMSVIIPDNGDILVRYHPSDSGALPPKPITVGSEQLTINPWYSPWVITPHSMSPPQELGGVGEQAREMDGVRIVLQSSGRYAGDESSVVFHTRGATRRHLDRK
jgi:hypothetical protein